MNDADRTCEYVLDPDNPDTWGEEESNECYVDDEVLNGDGVWACAYTAEDREKLCLNGSVQSTVGKRKSS